MKIARALFALAQSMLYVTAVGAATDPNAVDADYHSKLAQPTSCGNRPYLARVAADYRIACDQIAKALQTTIRNSGAQCDHVTVASPAIKDSPISEVLCVVRGGDVVLGLTTNTVNYLVTPTRVERLPADVRKSRAAVEAAVASAITQRAANAVPSTARELGASYDPLPPNWNVVLNRQGWLSVGAQYCTQRGECKVIGENLGPIPLGDGRTAPPQIGCRVNPDYPACVSGRVPVQLLVQAPGMGPVIVRMNDKNYAVGSPPWAAEKSDGSAIGGPIMVEESGELLPLHYLQTGKTRAARQEAVRKVELRRMQAVANDLSIRGKRCDKLVSVAKTSEGGEFTATCLIKGKEKQYKLYFSGLE